ncbi:LOW QUALITY PROTEIN: adhesion G-protein coupled receptor G7 [Acridotheres tristis]
MVKNTVSKQGTVPTYTMGMNPLNADDKKDVIADSLHYNTPSLHWERILVGVTCCLVTVTLWALCIWQLLRFKAGTTEPMEPLCFCLNSGSSGDKPACARGVGGIFLSYRVKSFSAFIHDLDHGTAGPLSKYAHNTEAGVGRGIADTLHGRASMQKNLRNLKMIPTETSRCPTGISAGLYARDLGNASTGIQMCSRERKIPTLKPPQILNCNENLDSLASQVETVSSREVSLIASNTQILSSMPDLTRQNITAIANIAVQIMKKPNVSEDFQASVTVMATVSQLLDVNKTELIHNTLVSATTSVAIQSAPLNLSSSMILFLVQRSESMLGKFQSTKLEIQENVPGLIGDLSTEVQILFNILSNNKTIMCFDFLHQELIPDVTESLDNMCNHTTNFAVQMAFQMKKYAKPLDYIYIGVGLSMAGLVIRILFQIFTRKTQNLSAKMLVSLCFSVLNFNIIFISGIENQTCRKCSSNTTRCYQQYLPYDAASTTLLTFDMVSPPADSWCPAAAVLLHYLLLATFLWSALSSALFTVMHGSIEEISSIVVAITLAATDREGKALNCQQEELCWLAALDRNQNFSVNKKDSLMKNISTISVVVVLKMAWIIGYLLLISSEKTSLAFSFLFYILNATQSTLPFPLQGLQICILFTFRIPLFKKEVSKVFLVFQHRQPTKAKARISKETLSERGLAEARLNRHGAQ